MNGLETDVANGIKDQIHYLIQSYNNSNGKIPKEIHKKFVKNDLGFRVHKLDLAALIDNDILSELDGQTIVTEEGDIFSIDYDKTSMWFTIKQS